MSTYTVRYKKDVTGWWVASVKEVRGCHTQGRTIDQARKRIREALSLFVNDAQKAELIDNVTLPANARNALNLALATRKRVEKEAIKLQQSTILAARILTKEYGVSVRDAGELLGLSHQRVHQLLTGGAANQSVISVNKTGMPSRNVPLNKTGLSPSRKAVR